MLKNLIINNYKWIAFFICLLLFFALAEDVFNHDIMNGDVIGYKFVSTYLIHDSITGFVKMITWCGSATCLILLTIVLFAFIKNKKNRNFNRNKFSYNYYIKSNFQIYSSKTETNRI